MVSEKVYFSGVTKQSEFTESFILSVYLEIVMTFFDVKSYKAICL